MAQHHGLWCKPALYISVGASCHHSVNDHKLILKLFHIFIINVDVIGIRLQYSVMTTKMTASLNISLQQMEHNIVQIHNNGLCN